MLIKTKIIDVKVTGQQHIEKFEQLLDQFETAHRPHYRQIWVTPIFGETGRMFTCIFQYAEGGASDADLNRPVA